MYCEDYTTSAGTYQRIDWELRKLKDVAISIRGSFPQPYTNPDFYDEENGKPFVQVADIGFDLKLNPDTKAHISKLAEPKSRFVKAGKVVVALQGSIEKSIGRTAITQYDAYFDRTILIFEDYKIPIEKQYFAQVIKKLFEREKERAWGATISTITKKHLNDFIIETPSIKEQQKIGQFFREFDNLITLHQRKLDALKRLKEAYLQNMFPGKGESVPRFRFANFDDKWKQRKLGDCFDERNERSDVGEMISVTINSGVVKSKSLDRKDNSSPNKSNYKKVEVGDIAYNSMRMWQGASGLSNYAGILSPAYTVLVPNEGISPLFFSYLFKLPKMIYTFQSNSQGLTSDTWNLKYPVLKNINVFIPTCEEQKEIGNFIKKIDKNIQVQQTKLSKLYLLKKSYLQKMFV